MLELKKVEEEILKFWEKNNIYEKVKKKNSKGKPYYFLQGPPYTSGKLHIGHAWNNSLKDIILRYKRMCGYDVWDRAGYDMHGLPTENKVQKELGFKDKNEILKYGVDKFVKECMNFSIRYMKLMNEDLWRLGVWMDYENAYMPIKKDYIEGEWFLFKRAWEQNRLYKGKKIMHWDAESETSLAKHELEYEKVKDVSVFLKMKKKSGNNEYFIIWTTTPWTIPYNLAIMVNPELEYVEVEVENEKWIVAKALAGAFISGLLGKKFRVIKEFKGYEMEGMEYIPIFEKELEDVYKELKKTQKNIHTIILSEKYVDTSAGTGLVHCAPGCGPEDYEVGKEYGIDAFNTLNEKGEFENMGKYSGWKAKEDDEKFIIEMERRGAVVAKSVVEHEYPHSWRSKKPVIFRATEQWFLKIEDLIPTLLEYNQKVNWIPKKSGESYNRWTENLKDNGVTRQRFWGCPAPIWSCECGNTEVIGSLKELSRKAGKRLDNLELHKPWIDKIEIKCKKCEKMMKRIPDVVDVWIDSGTASWNCLYNNPKLIKRYFPAKIIIEATEQTRLWFNMLQICSAIALGKSCYENVYTHGMILDYQGMKMSKSLGNIISPYEVVDKYSADILRYYVCGVSAGENINFSWDDVKVKQGNLNIFINIANYILDLERQNPKKGKPEVEEEWILSKYNSTLQRVSELYEAYRIDEVITEIEKLFLSVSKDYIKLVRDKSSRDSAVLDTLKEVYTGILKMFSTICPFITEKIWQQLRNAKIVKEESVHLCEWPSYDIKKIEKELEIKFELILKIIEIGLAKRDEAKIGLKWPLSKATISTREKIDECLVKIIARQLNVKSVEIKTSNELDIELDTKITKELEAEGFSRELARNIQAERKKLGMKKGDLAEIEVSSEKEILEFFKIHKDFLEERTNSKINFAVDKIPRGAKSFTIKEKKVYFFFCNYKGAVKKKI